MHGDALTAQFPTAFQQERLAKTCAWLRDLRPDQHPGARTQMLTALHLLWPTYCDECSEAPLAPTPTSDGTDEYQQRRWKIVEQLDSLWVEPDPTNRHETAPYLPEFRDTPCGRVSYSWHLTLLALVTLNQQLGRPLLDLKED